MCDWLVQLQPIEREKPEDWSEEGGAASVSIAGTTMYCVSALPFALGAIQGSGGKPLSQVVTHPGPVQMFSSGKAIV